MWVLVTPGATEVPPGPKGGIQEVNRQTCQCIARYGRGNFCKNRNRVFLGRGRPGLCMPADLARVLGKEPGPYRGLTTRPADRPGSSVHREVCSALVFPADGPPWPLRPVPPCREPWHLLFGNLRPPASALWPCGCPRGAGASLRGPDDVPRPRLHRCLQPGRQPLRARGPWTLESKWDPLVVAEMLWALSLTTQAGTCPEMRGHGPSSTHLEGGQVPRQSAEGMGPWRRLEEGSWGSAGSWGMLTMSQGPGLLRPSSGQSSQPRWGSQEGHTGRGGAWVCGGP